MQINLKIGRSVSLSSAGKKYDRYFQKSKPLSLQKASANLRRVKSTNTIILPKIKTEQTEKQECIPSEQLKSKDRLTRLSKRAQQEKQMRERIKSEIQALKSSVTKSRKLVLGNHKRQERITRNSIQLPPGQAEVKTIQSWKDLKKMTPSAGYLYIDSNIEPRTKFNSERKVTLSKDYVLITEPNQQQILSVNEYESILKKYESLSTITFFKWFHLMKIFRKWRIICEFHQMLNKINLVQGRVKGLYSEVYVQLINLLQKIRRCKFVGSISQRSIMMHEYPDYLYTCSSSLLEDIHYYVFVACIDVIFKPIKDLILSIKAKEEEKNKAKNISRPGKKLQIIRQKKYEGVLQFNYLKSTQFRQQFLKYVQVIKKCLYIYTEHYIEWIKDLLLEQITKIERTLSKWVEQKHKFNDILNTIIFGSQEKYTYYSPELTECEITLITYSFEMNADKQISFQVNQNYLVSLFQQYSDYLTNNLTFLKLVQCYAQNKHKILPQELSQKRNQYAQLQILQEIIKTNDWYCCQQILHNLNLRALFTVRLKKTVSANFVQIYAIIDMYNQMIGDFYNNIDSQSQSHPTITFEYLEAMRIKLVYLPQKVNVGLFALNFSIIHQYLQLQVAYRQTEIYKNVPSDFKKLFNEVRELMDKAYRQIKNSMWTIDELLFSYSAFEKYEQYRINQLHQDIDKFKGYLQVIGAKCNQHYQECFLMFVHIKEMRDKLQIKNQIFTQGLPNKLKYFRNNIEQIREDIWKGMFTEQTQIISTCKQPTQLAEKLQALMTIHTHLDELKRCMDKLETIGRLQMEYFIEQELTVNTHAYLKMNNDINLLIDFTGKYLRFKSLIEQLFPKSITQVRIDDYLQILRANVSEIKQVYLLLIVYQTILRDILQKYEEWRRYLQTIGEIMFLSQEEINTIQRIKEVKFHMKSNITLAECYRSNIQTIYQEIHQIKQKKIKISELNSLLTDLESLQSQPPFQITINRNKIPRQSKTSAVTTRSLDQKPKMQHPRLTDNTNYQFQNYNNIYKSLQQFQNELKILTNSPYLNDYKLQLTLRADQLEKALGLLDIVTESRKQYNQIMKIELFDNHQEAFREGRTDQKKWLMSEQILVFFQDYRRQRQEIRECWIKVINGLGKKSMTELLASHQQIEGAIKILNLKMHNLRQWIDSVIHKKRQQLYLLNLLDSSTVLAIIQYPSYYFEIFYPIKEIRKPEATIQVTTIYDEKFILQKADNEKDVLIEITNLQIKLSNELRRQLARHRGKHPIDYLMSYLSQQTPLQVVYVIDHLYFSSKYLTPDKTSANIVKGLQGEIKLLCRNGLKLEFDNAKINYSLALFDQMLGSRIELRTRVDHNQNYQIWYRNILVFEMYENMLILRNFNTMILSSFHLVDNSHLSFAFPFAEKSLVKICNAMRFQQSIVINQTELVQTIAAKTMSLYYKVVISPTNVENVLSACHQLYPLFVVGVLPNLEEGLPLVFQELNKIERVNSLKTRLAKDARLLPSIFIYCENVTAVELSETLKLRFRSISSISPCPQVLLCSRMLSFDYLIERSLFLNMVYMLRTFIILLKERNNYSMTFSQLIKLCDRIIKQMSRVTTDVTDRQLLASHFRDYSLAIKDSQIQSFSFDQFFGAFIQNKNRVDYEKSSIYDLAQNIISTTTYKDLSFPEDPSVIYRLKEYNNMKKVLQKFIQNLITQKYETAFLDNLAEIFEVSFNLDNRPLAIIGGHQSGKSLLLKLYFKYLGETLGNCRLNWRFCNVQTFNLVLGQLNENEPIIESFITDYQDKDISWIVFEGFIFQRNVSLLEHIFSRISQEVKIKSPLANNDSISFCDLYRCRQKYCHEIKSLHTKYIGFQLTDLKCMSPSYICAMNKIYISDGAVSISTYYFVAINTMLREFVDRKQEIYSKMTEAFNQLYHYLSGLLDEILIQKIKSFEWIITVNLKSGIERTINYFLTFFQMEGRQKLDYLFLGEDYSLKLCKLITYCLFVTFSNFVDQNSRSLLSKVIKGVYYGLNQDQTRDHFLTKICYFTSQQLSYYEFEIIKEKQKIVSKQLPFMNIIQTQQMKFIYRKYLKQLVQMQVPIMIIGNKESGKTSMIKMFLYEYFKGGISMRGAHPEVSLKEFNLKMAGSNGLQNIISSKQNLQKPHQDLFKITDYVVYIEDVSIQQQLSGIQRYMRYIKTHKVYIDDSRLKQAPILTPIFQRRTLGAKIQSQIWDMYIVNFQINKEYFDRVFSVFMQSKIETYLKAKGKKNITFNNLLKLSQKYIKVMKFCTENFKRGNKTWTYDFGIYTLKFILENFIDRFNYDDILTEQELTSRMNAQIFGRIKNRLQQLRQIDKIDDRMVNILDSNQCLSMEEYKQREALLFNCIEDENADSRKIKNVILNDELKSFGPKLAAALRTAECILINKVNVPFHRSVASILVEMLKLPVKQILFSQNQNKFMSQIEKATELTFKKNSVAYYYVSLQELINNPQLLKYISIILMKSQQSSQEIKKQDSSHQCKFILQYSIHHYQSIAGYLKANILSISNVLHYREKNNQELNDIAVKLIEQKNFNGTTFTVNMDEAIKMTIKIFEELQTFEPPKYLSHYLFSNLTYSHLLMQVLQSYNYFQKRLQTKRSALDLSLSELNYMFKEYKQRNGVYKQFLSQESALLCQIGIDKSEQRQKNQEYNSIKNQNLKETIQQNESQIVRLLKERDKILSSEKIWVNIYRNAHNSISRTQFAELKYMFLTNYNIDKDLFETISFVLGEQTDILSVKKCFSDINIMAKIKELSIPDLPAQRLKDLQARLLIVESKQKLSCGKNILEWMKVGCKLGLHRIQRSNMMTGLDVRIKRLQDQNIQIRAMNKMDETEKQLQQLQKRIDQKSAELYIVQTKIKSIGNQLEEVKKQFEELLDFQTYCLQQLQNLKQNSKKILNFCINNAIQFTFVEVLAGDIRKKFRELANAKLRKSFGNLVSNDECQYFDLLGKSQDDYEEQKWLIRPKQYLSASKKKLILEINNFLIQHNQPLAIVDRRSALLQDTVKNNALLLRMSKMMRGKIQKQFQKYNLIIIEMDSWIFSLRFSNNQYESIGKYRIFKYKHIRLILPHHLPIIFVMNSFGEQQFLANYKIIDIQYSVEDYYEIIQNIIIKRRVKKSQKQDLFAKRVKVQKCLMNIVYFLCRKTQSINLKSKDLIKILTKKIQQFNQQKSSNKTLFYPRPSDQSHIQADDKLCRVVSKIIELMVTYFPSRQHTSFFFRDLLNTSCDYIEMQGVQDNRNIIYLIMQLLTEGFKDKFPFIYLYYVKIFAIQEGIATIIEAQNLTSIIEPREQISDCFKEIDKDSSSFFKYLPYKSMELQKIYKKIMKSKLKSQAQMFKAIDSQTGVSDFNRLILKRALAPKNFQIQIGKILRQFEDKITLKNKMFLRRYVVKQKLFCVCDAGFWISKLKFTDDFKLVQLSKLTDNNLALVQKLETWAVFDDMEEGQLKNNMLQQLMRLNSQKVSTVLFSKQFLGEEFCEQFKFLPFQHLLNIFQIKELTKVSRSKYSNVFNKVIYFKTEMLRRKPFNQRISFSFLFEKIREQIMNKQDYTIDELVLHFQWDFFLWDPTFEANHFNLQFILDQVDFNPVLINEFVADDSLQDRINAVIAKSKRIESDQSQICKLAHQLRDSSSKLQVKDRAGFKYGLKGDIFYRQFDFKKVKLLKQTQIIKRISQIQIGKAELNWQMIIEMKNLLNRFSYNVFGEVLVKLMNWKKMQQFRQIVNIGEMESEFNIYLLFQHSLFVYYEMQDLELENLKQRYKSRTNDELPTPSQASNRSRPTIDKQRSHEKIPLNHQNLNIRKISHIQKDGEHSKNQMKRSFRSFNAVKQLLSKGRRLSIAIQPHLNQGDDKINEEEMIQQFCKDSLYVIENRVIVLKKLSIKQQRPITSKMQRTLDLPDNRWSLRIVDLNNLISNDQAMGSRFSKN